MVAHTDFDNSQSRLDFYPGIHFTVPHVAFRKVDWDFLDPVAQLLCQEAHFHQENITSGTDTVQADVLQGTGLPAFKTSRSIVGMRSQDHAYPDRVCPPAEQTTIPATSVRLR